MLIFLGSVIKTDSAPNLNEQDRTGDMVNNFVTENKSRYKVIQKQF